VVSVHGLEPGSTVVLRRSRRSPRDRRLVGLGIHHAMAVPAVLCAGIVALAATVPRADATSADSSTGSGTFGRRWGRAAGSLDVETTTP